MINNIEVAFFGKDVNYAHSILAKCNLTAKSIKFLGNESNGHTYHVATITDINTSKVTKKQLVSVEQQYKRKPALEEVIKHLIAEQIHKR